MKKLVRNNIPQIIKKSGKNPLYFVADEFEYKKHLKEKLLEEVLEFIESEEIEELADILEVLEAIYENSKINLQYLLKVKDEKKQIRGSFSKKYILKS